MSDRRKNPGHGAGRYTPTVVDSSLKGVPEDFVTVEMMPDRDVNWLQAIRKDTLPEEPNSKSADLETRIDKVWSAVEGMNASDGLENVRASD